MIKPFECSCPECVACCHRRPGWTTPIEAQDLIDKGHADKLMIDWWVADPYIYMIVPAIVGHEKKYASSFPEGTCSFLVNDLCSIHSDKPHECKVCGCDQHSNMAEKEYEQFRKSIVDSWNTDEGRSMVAKFESRIMK